MSPLSGIAKLTPCYPLIVPQMTREVSSPPEGGFPGPGDGEGPPVPQGRQLQGVTLAQGWGVV